METIPNALRVLATQFERLVRGTSRGGQGGDGGSTSGLTDGILNLSGSNATGGSQALTGGLAGSLVSGLTGGADGDGWQSQLASTLPVAGLASSAVEGVAGGPLGLLTRSLLALFRRTPEPVSFLTYEAPEALSVDFDLGSLSREVRDGGATNGTPVSSSAVSSARNGSPAPVVIQVNTMDARSFADHRDDIASAVREALTRNHALRDEIWED